MTTNKANKTKFCLLGLLSQKPMSGYEINKNLKENTKFFWSESFGQVYPALTELTNEKLIELCDTQNKIKGRKPKQIYSITSIGREKLIAWLQKSVELQNNRNELLLKLYFGWNLGNQECIFHIKARQIKLQEKLKKINNLYERVHRESSEQAFHHKLTLMHALKIKSAEISWCEDVIKMLES